ncbi:hypothetical protein D6C87_07112 [Aureobasidium pullulans]|uniref:C2H2-type domain-containing protein n=1 Tax=Aureobasidium pullulans TaxID=5580 RepID=A0AB38LTX1_AURPU|nr:hypothetical protein D6C94_06440 [Aureobasidium pullulans]THZ39454.1 hypothetical protein D6C87_07112 [Aureobasidium pullulans]
MANSSTPNPNAPDNGSRATYTENLPRRLRSSGPIAGSSSSTTAGSTSSLTAGSTSSTTAGSTSSFVPPHDPAVPTPAPPSDPAYFRCDKAIEDGTQCTWDFGTQIQLDNHVKSTRHAKLEICPICPTTGPLRKIARADRGNNSRSSSSTLARNIQTFHASKPKKNKLADTDEIESNLLG